MTAAKPQRPPALAHGRWMGDFPDLSAAEKALVAACAHGEVWEPIGWDKKRPEKATEADTIRAELIRFLLLGGDADHPVHEEGVMVRGAWIGGRLDLHQAIAPVRLDAHQCHFAETPIFMGASLPELALIGSHCPGIKADRLTVAGDLFLRDAAVKGAIDLTAAKVGTLIDGDALGCWDKGRHFLDGFRYDQISGFTDAAQRIGWLKSQREDHLTSDFMPQPWEQLIKVLREMGHPHAAADVAIAKQEQMRVAGVIKGWHRRPLHWLYGKLAGYGHRPMKAVAAMSIVWLLSAFFFQIGGSYGYLGPTTPLLNSPELAAKINAACGNRRDNGKTIWTKCAAIPPEYTTFQPLAYSADLILPLVNLQQEADWAPIVSVPSGANMGFGVFLRFLMWFEILFGWAMSLMLVAVLGRLVDKD